MSKDTHYVKVTQEQSTDNAPETTKRYTRAEFIRLAGQAMLGVGILSVIPFGNTLLKEKGGYGARTYGE